MIQFAIGDGNPKTPSVNSTFYKNTELLGKKLKVTKNGYGVLFEGKDFSNYYQGGIVLLGGAVFGANEEYTIELVII